MPKHKNLVVFHMESVGWQSVHAFPEAFPNLHALFTRGRSYPAFFSSATSTHMALASFMHANDFEMDAAPHLSAPAANNPSLFKSLEAVGYNTVFLCATDSPGKTMLPQFAATLPPIWTTNDFSALLERFEGVIGTLPFAAYVWSQIPHFSASLGLAGHARGIDDLVAGSAAVMDNLLGAVVEILRRHHLIDATTIVVYGDHGDDFWTHGFKMGMMHGVEPFTPLVHTPLVILDSDLPPGRDNRLASTVDLAPTCLDLLGLPKDHVFPVSGVSMRGPAGRDVVFSQNFTANQHVGRRRWRVQRRRAKKCFAASNHAYTLLVSDLGLELYNFRIDPSNHLNILNFFDLDRGGMLRMVPAPDAASSHYVTFRHLWRGGDLQDIFGSLREALKAHVAAKNDYAVRHAKVRLDLLDLAAFDRINRSGWTEFFGVAWWRAPTRSGRISRPFNAAIGTFLLRSARKCRHLVAEMTSRLR